MRIVYGSLGEVARTSAELSKLRWAAQPAAYWSTLPVARMTTMPESSVRHFMSLRAHAFSETA
ncbi:hypothetical protein PUN4_630075 [Paraburkholderia unamae]|nr:hypothetical protein PUN4_630075 [Paraburkholderia unamae]